MYRVAYRSIPEGHEGELRDERHAHEVHEIGEQLSATRPSGVCLDLGRFRRLEGTPELHRSDRERRAGERLPQCTEVPEGKL